MSKSTKATSPILLPFEKDEEDADGFNMAVVFPIMVRVGGFMVASPSSPIAQAALEAVDCGLEIEPAVYHGTLQLETTGGRRLGEVDAILVDFPWAAATALSPSAAMKSLPPGKAKAIQFTKDNAFGRPTRQSAEDLAARWIGSTLDEETAQEYPTGEELEPVEGQPHDGAEAVSADVVQALQQRILELERQVQTPQTGTTVLEAKPKAPALLKPAGNYAGSNRLAEAPATGRISPSSCGETGSPKSMAFDHVLADVEGLDLIAQDGDALSKVMMGQLRQNQLLLQKLLGPRYQDPVLGALSGSSGSDSASASSGVKGCLARDAFIRAMTDLQKVAAVTQANAAKELGLSEEKIDGNLMKKYVERRIPIGDNKMVGYIAFMMAEAWMVGWEAENVQLLGMVSKVLYFLEQTSLDGGKMQLSWLLTGMAEPPFNLYSNNRRRAGLQPFCRLCHPTWVAANLSYVRDLDILESKMLTMGKPSKALQQQEEVEPEDAARPKRRVRPPKAKERKVASRTKYLHDEAFIDSKEPGMSQGSVADVCALDPDSNASHCSSRSRGPHNISDELPNLSDPSRVFNPIKLAEQLITQFWSCRSAVTAFAHSSLAGTTCPVEKTINRSLMPVPPIRWRWTAASRLGPRRRRRRLYHRTRAALLNLMLISLNWETLGFPSEAPPEASVGSYHTAQQHEAVERLEAMLDHFLHMAPFGSDELGRASERFQSVIECIKELPKCKLELQDLFHCLVHVKEGFDSYSKYSNLASKDPQGSSNSSVFRERWHSVYLNLG